ncbi:hypothetical protein WJX77_000304 [Trebouxia sp. C0004]
MKPAAWPLLGRLVFLLSVSTASSLSKKSRFGCKHSVDGADLPLQPELRQVRHALLTMRRDSCSSNQTVCEELSSMPYNGF